ncbi:hypothetical protein [Guyparkeria sp.]|uniref:hypothetical protein n=1 Tax=Guyparkeria sp. TaxID=2035736 RepID=UPI00356251C8
MSRHLARAGTGLALALLAALALAGCSQGPDRAEVQAALQQQIDPRAEVVIVERIDSMNAAERGEVWLVDVEATLRFPRDLADVARDMGGADAGESALDHLGRVGLMLRFGEFEAGETRPYRTRLELIEGRDGWMPVARD